MGCAGRGVPRCKTSGPLLDRVDIHIEVPAVEYRDLSSARPGQSSAEMYGLVMAARERQMARLKGAKMLTNAQMPNRLVEQHCHLDGPTAAIQARISHQPSAASTYLTPSQGPLLHGVLDVLASTSASAALRDALDLTQPTRSRDEAG